MELFVLSTKSYTCNQTTDNRTIDYHCHTNHPQLHAVPTIMLTGGGERARTDDLRLAKPALSQLSYTPFAKRKANQQVSLTALEEANENPLAKTNHLSSDVVGLGRFELPTSRLSGVRSNQLSYRPLRAGAWKQVKGCEDGDAE